jgi:ribonucleotide reductase alpha subunit
LQGKLSPNAMTVLKRRYLRRNEQGELIEDPEGMFRRVARNISLMDLLYYPAVYDVEAGKRPKMMLKRGSCLDTPSGTWRLCGGPMDASTNGVT